MGKALGSWGRGHPSGLRRQKSKKPADLGSIPSESAILPSSHGMSQSGHLRENHFSA
jgi:hypothetical protein